MSFILLPSLNYSKKEIVILKKVFSTIKLLLVGPKYSPNILLPLHQGLLELNILFDQTPHKEFLSFLLQLQVRLVFAPLNNKRRISKIL